MPLPASLEPEPEVFRVGARLSVLPQGQVDLLDGQALAFRRVHVAELKAGEGRRLTDDANKCPAIIFVQF